MNLNNIRLILSAASSKQFPKSDQPEIVFIGRSNVGKSSLINTLLNRKNFARTSATPGKTATINFFELDSKLVIADLPGYGFAKVSKTEKERWRGLIESYLNSDRNIALLIQLIDIRHAPTADDKMMVDWIKQSGLDYIVVCTKADKLSKSDVDKNIDTITRDLELPENKKAIIFSSKTGCGRELILSILENKI